MPLGQGAVRCVREHTLRVEPEPGSHPGAAEFIGDIGRTITWRRDILLPQYVADAIDKHIADHGTTSDGYLYQGRKYELVIRRSYQQDFTRSAAKAGLPPHFVPHSLRHHFASAALARGIPITEVSRWLGHRSIDTTHRIYGHIVPSSLDRARAVLDEAYQQARRAGDSQPMRSWPSGVAD